MMMNDLKYFENFLAEKCPGAKLLMVSLRGSQAYGTQTESSDYDYIGIYVQPIDDVIGFGYKEQLNDDKGDIVFYEVRRFIDLLSTNNPTIMEALNYPEDCFIYKHDLFDYLISFRDKFITKMCHKSFSGYAIEQIKKARGQNKKQNWKSEKVSRKTPIDFCYIHKGNDSYPLSRYLEDQKIDQKFCGLSKLPHSKDLYALYYDSYSKDYFVDKPKLYSKFIRIFTGLEPMGFKGISFESSNDIRLSSIPKYCPKAFFIGYVSYNKDGYSQHCNEYKSYQEWLEKSNPQRWIDVKSHGQKIDGKNMMHCRRLLTMSKEIAEGKGIIVRRPDAEYLLGIRKGLVDLESLISQSENDIKEIDKIFMDSNLPDSIDRKLCNNILIYIRRSLFN